MTTLTTRLGELLAKATPGNLETAQRHIECETVECPACGGDGEIEAADYCNFDGVALGVQFYGIGKEFGVHEALWRETIAALPELLRTIEGLEAENARLREALEPFAKLVNTWTVETGNMLTLSNGERMCGIGAENFRRARSALPAREEERNV